MEIIFEIIFELVFDGAIETSKNKKVPKIIRYPLLFIIALLYLGVIGIIIFTGVLCYLRLNKICGILFIILGVIFFVISIIRFKKVYLKRKNIE